MVIIEKQREEIVTDVKTFEDVVYNSSNSSSLVKIFGIPIWKSTLKVGIPNKNTVNKDKKIGFNADKN